MSHRYRRRRWPAGSHVALLALVLCLSRAAELRAQSSIQISNVRPLAFGDVLPGVPLTVRPTDPARSGLFEITGPNAATIEITFSLPNALVAPSGATLPVTFDEISAGFSASGVIGSQMLFDPRTPIRVKLNELGRGTGFIGGSLNPPGAQQPGTYGAAISVTIALLIL